MKTLYFFAMISAMVLTYCNTPKSVENDKSKSDSMEYPLVGTHWKIIEVNGDTVSIHNSMEREAFIQLGKDNKFQGNGSCNKLLGNYELMDGYRIRFSDVGITMMACPSMETDSKVLSALQTCDNYTLSGKYLTLNKAKMAPLMRLEAQ
jgi:heat shock protein HslJ